METEFTFCGEMIAPAGLHEVMKLLEPCSWPIKLVQSGYDKTFYLRASCDEFDLGMDSDQGPDYLFGGGITGTLDQARELLSELSNCLLAGKIAHRLELCEEAGAQSQVGYFHYRWPEGQSWPTR